jgi:hypothetical protein
MEARREAGEDVVAVPAEHAYGNCTIVVDRDGFEPDRPWTWQAWHDGAVLLEGEASFDEQSALREAEDAIRDYDDGEEC